MSRQAANSPIRVLIVDDSAFMRTAISRMIASDPNISIVGTAASGMEALEKIPTLNPDVITLDVQMPGLDGLETLSRIMAEFPRPVIMVSSLTLKDAETTFSALAAGAFDYVPKELSSASLNILHLQNDLIAKIKAAAASGLRRAAVIAPRKLARAASNPMRDASLSAPAIVAIGVSTGGPKALQEILPLLPADLPLPILIVQHMPAGFTEPFARRLDSLCAVAVCEAKHGRVIQPGVVYIAPAGTHLTVDRGSSRTTLCLSNKPENQLHTPSVDVLMHSVASAFRSLAMGIIMTGMGLDGAQGMKAIHGEGGFTVGQDEPSCTVYGMPRACAELGILDRVVPLAEIPHEILHAMHYRRASVS
ncbi:MAG: chemotaxis response regulator protein-glutamate methylesterase [Candidatus Sulfotelmatobacter sp.]